MGGKNTAGTLMGWWEKENFVTVSIELMIATLQAN